LRSYINLSEGQTADAPVGSKDSKPTVVILIGMAGSGKTTVMQVSPQHTTVL